MSKSLNKQASGSKGRVGGNSTESRHGNKKTTKHNKKRSPREPPANEEKRERGELNPSTVLPSDKRPRCTDLKNLECIRTLGQGSYGRVVLARAGNADATGTDSKRPLLAIKIARKRFIRRNIQEMALGKDMERHTLSKLPWSQWVSGVVDAFHDPKNFYLVLELVPCGTLRSIIHRLGSSESSNVNFYFANIVCGLEFLHRHSIVHRDLKPDNILVGRDGYLVLADFGSSRNEHDESGWLGGETAAYMAPECILYPEGEKPGSATDWWAAGCILFEMVTRKRAFGDVDDRKTKKRVLEVDYQWPKGKRFGTRVKDLTERLLAESVQERLGFCLVPGKGAKAVMNHPWLHKIRWSKMKNRGYIAPYIPSDPALTEKWHGWRLPLQPDVPGLRVVDPPARCRWDNRYEPIPRAVPK